MPAIRHLYRALVKPTLERGGGVEQLLAPGAADHMPTVRWLTLFPQEGGVFTLLRHEVVDIGSDEFAYLDAFPPLDPEEAIGEGVEVGTYSTVERALQAAQAMGASVDRWVNQGMVEDEYLESSSAPHRNAQ